MKTTTHKFSNLEIGITDKDFQALPFGRQIEFFPKIEKFKERAKHVWISQKRRSTASAIKEFRSLYKPTAYYYKLVTGTDYRDDSIQIWYTSNE